MMKKREGLVGSKEEIEFLRAERVEKARLRRPKADYKRSRRHILYVLLLSMS